MDSSGNPPRHLRRLVFIAMELFPMEGRLDLEEKARAAKTRGTPDPAAGP